MIRLCLQDIQANLLLLQSRNHTVSEQARSIESIVRTKARVTVRRRVVIITNELARDLSSSVRSYPVCALYLLKQPKRTLLSQEERQWISVIVH